MSMTQQAKEEVERLLREGGNIAAVKHLKDKYGFSLRESKVIVDAMEGKVSALPGRKSELDASATARLSELLHAGKKFEAIKLVKGALGVRLANARGIVERYERLLNPGKSSARRLTSGPGMFTLVVFGGAGLILTMIACYIIFSDYAAVQSSDPVTGRVVRMSAKSDGSTSPVIEYEWGGDKWLHASSSYSNPPTYELDEAVPLYVNRDDPATIVVDTFMGRWLLPTIIGSMGLIFGCIGIIGGLGNRNPGGL